MDIKRLKINPLLGLALLATVVAVVFAPDEPQVDDATVQPARRPPTQAMTSVPGLTFALPGAATQTSEPSLSAGAPDTRADVEGRIIDIFAVPRKPVPKQMAAAPEVPAAPVAPPFDYEYMGHVVEQGEESFFFTRADRPYIVKIGDTLDGSFLLESVSGNVAVVVYVPLGLKQTVVLGEGK